MENNNPAAPRLHARLYLICPKMEYTSSKTLLQSLDKLIQPFKDDATGVLINLNSEDKYAEALINDYRQQHPETSLTIKTHEPDFAKHKKLAYVKRNQRLVLRASHIIVIKADVVSPAQDYIIQHVEDLDKHLLVWSLVKKPQGDTHGKE